MNTLTQSHQFTMASPRRLQRCLGWFRSLLDGMRRAHRQRAMLRALDALDERTLHDIGVHRDELDSFVAELLGAVPATRRRVLNFVTAPPESM